jgi:hypothetical protein
MSDGTRTGEATAAIHQWWPGVRTRPHGYGHFGDCGSVYGGDGHGDVICVAVTFDNSDSRWRATIYVKVHETSEWVSMSFYSLDSAADALWHARDKAFDYAGNKCKAKVARWEARAKAFRDALSAHPKSEAEKRLQLSARRQALDCVSAAIDKEHARWGGSERDDERHPSEWLDYIARQLTMASHAASYDDYRDRLVKVAALAVAAFESSERREARGDDAFARAMGADLEAG